MVWTTFAREPSAQLASATLVRRLTRSGWGRVGPSWRSRDQLRGSLAQSEALADPDLLRLEVVSVPRPTPRLAG